MKQEQATVDEVNPLVDRSFVRLTVFLLLFAVVLFVSWTRELLSPKTLFSIVIIWISAWFMRNIISSVGWMSLLGLTWIAGMVVFFVKWMVVSPPPPTGDLVGQPAFFDRDGALFAFSLFLAAFALSYRVMASRTRRRQTQPRTDGVRAVTPPLIFITAALIGLRYFAAVRWNIGVPGQLPDPVPFRGVIYVVSNYGGLAGAIFLFWQSSHNRATRWAAAILLLLYALVGASIGWRGYALVALMGWLFVRDTRGPKDNAPALRVRSLITVGIGLMVVTFFVLFATERRILPTGSDTSPPLAAIEFLLHRSGGIEYLAPVVGQVDLVGSDLSRLSPGSWDEFVKTGVYRFPSGAVTGVAGTGIGWWYAAAGTAGVIVAGCVAGSLCGFLDRKRNRYSDHPRSISWFGVYLGWLVLFLEGTPGNAFLTLAGIVASVEAFSFAAKILQPRR